MTYTEEQLKKIAEWMELNISKTTEYNKNKPLVWSYGREFEDWLHSPEGQAAVMDKLSAGGKMVTFIPVGRSRETYGCLLAMVDSHAKTRQEALINAVLKMLEAK